MGFKDLSIHIEFIARVALEGEGEAYSQDKYTYAGTLAENGRGACTCQRGRIRVTPWYMYDTKLEITVGHQTFSVHIAQMFEHSSLCART